jgi:hypothetical protein
MLSVRKHGRHRALKRRLFITRLGGAVTWPLATSVRRQESMSESDKVFAGSVPENYDRYLVPLIFDVLPCDHAEAVVLDLMPPHRARGVCWVLVGRQGEAKPAGRTRIYMAA